MIKQKVNYKLNGVSRSINVPVGTTAKQIRREVLRRSKLLKREYRVELKMMRGRYRAYFIPRATFTSIELESEAPIFKKHESRHRSDGSAPSFHIDMKNRAH